VGSTTAPAGGTVVAVVAVVLFGFELELELTHMVRVLKQRILW